MSTYKYYTLFIIYVIVFHKISGIQQDEPRCTTSADYYISNKLLMLEQEIKQLKETVKNQEGVMNEMKSHNNGMLI